MLRFPFFLVVGTVQHFGYFESYVSLAEQIIALTKKTQGQQKYHAEGPEDEVLHFPFFLVVCSTPGLISKV